MKKFFIILIFAYILPAYSQVSIKDSTIFTSMFYATYSYQLPGGDLAKRFGNNSAVGGGFQVKLKSNWLIGAEYNYLFGNKVKDDLSIFSNISTSDGFIIDSRGEYTELILSETGYQISLKAGKILPVFGPNKNSGILLTLQPGFLQHKIKILNPESAAPQINGSYKKGYDEMSNGFSLTEFVGYMYMGNNRLISFYAGFEFTQAFTKNRRPYNFNTMRRDLSQKYDFLYGIRVGWLIPLYKRAPKGYYY